MNVGEHNRTAWNRQAREGNRWTEPVDPETVAAARRGIWEVILTPNRPVPREWFGDVRNREILCLASGGGQQAPVLAAAGARVTSFDLSEEQLARDRGVAERDGLELRCVQGDMVDLGLFRDGSFDLVFNPVSTVFVPDVRPVWRECHRVLRTGGALLTGFMNPVFFLFDHDDAAERGVLEARYRLPYSEADPTDLTPRRREAVEGGEPMEFSHSLDDFLGGQLEAGFVLTGFYEDGWSDEETPLNRLTPTFMATRAVKPEGRT